METQTSSRDLDARRAGRQARKRLARSAQVYEPQVRNFDPIELIEQQNAERIPELIPIRHGRMAESAFAFYRGTAGIMAADLAERESTGITVQLCGDAHLSNFGAFASPERTLVLDVNDFDETLPGPFEWDLKRLATSVVLAVRDIGLSERAAHDAAFASAVAYDESIRDFARMSELDIWYSQVAAEDLISKIERGRWRRTYVDHIRKARHHNSLQAMAHLTEPFEGAFRIRNQPPLIQRLEEPSERERAENVIEAYRETLDESRRSLLDRYRPMDAALKAVGVGSVGLRCLVVLLLGRDGKDPLLLQVKEAKASVLEAHLPGSKYEQPGERVVCGQQLMQAASDIFLGWARATTGFHYYVRQFRDWKAFGDIIRPDEKGLTLRATVCARILARAHARAGGAVAIAKYVGRSDRFAEAIKDFAVAYADQAERDYQGFRSAIAAGRLPSVPAQRE